MRKMMFVVLLILLCTIFAVPAFAQGSAGGAGTTNWVAVTAAVAIAFAAGLAALGQGRAASAACEALGRNPAARPGIMVFLILGLAFIESLVLFTIVFTKFV